MTMDKKRFNELLPDYLDGVLDSVQKQKVEEYIAKNAQSAEELEQLKALFEAFAQEKTAIPSPRLEANFLALLEREKRAGQVIPMDTGTSSTVWGWNTLLKVAAGIALLAGMFLLGQYRQQKQSYNEIAALQLQGLELRQTAMLSLMENKSASKRIQGVGYTDGFHNLDEAIIKALTDRLLNDENANVRMASAEALERFAASERVKTAFIEALKVEKDPGIQITIIQVLVRIQEKKAIVPLQQLMQQDETQPFVKEHIQSLLPDII